jgi:membrane protease YdiL (CAAX protease family)
MIAGLSTADPAATRDRSLQAGIPIADWHALLTGVCFEAESCLQLAGQLSLSPQECTVVCDSAEQVAAAKAAGMRCVAVAHQSGAHELAEADLVRGALADVTLQDLAGTLISPPQINPQPPPFTQDNGAPDAASATPEVWGPWATLGFTVLTAISTIVAQGFAGAFFGVYLAMSGQKLDPSKLASNGLLLSLGTCAGAPVMVGFCWFFAWLRRGLPPNQYLGLNPVSVRQVVRWCGALLATVFLIDFLIWYFELPVDTEFMRRAYATSGSLPLLWFVLLVVAPISEEVLFRGFMFEGFLRSPAGAAGAIVIPAGFWAVIHMQYDFYGIASIFILGLLLGYARWKSGSICTTIYMHTLTNLVALGQVMLEQPLPGTN